MKRPWMPLFISDFLTDTTHLSATETGAYLLLIMAYWERDGLPDDDTQLAGIARLSRPAWRKVRPVLQAFFHDGWRHKRIDLELAKMIVTHQRRSAAASKAGTVSSMKRANGTSTQRARDVNGASTQRAPGVHHYTLSTDRPIPETARARPETPEFSEGGVPPAPPAPQPPPPGPAKGLADQAREAVQKSTDVASDALHATMREKGWLR
jgi:uncharacterized protein YdaU (DUF1376 family)